MPVNEPHHIIAIGASAGGMEEINTFFDHTPLDGVAYIIVQHLSSDFKSRMVELLAKHSKLEVVEAANGAAVEVNKVFLIPHDKFMTIKENRLYLTPKGKTKGPHMTINRFFVSLAVECGKKAIGVILSGLGSDGTDGIKSIKKGGGMVIARNPETSEFGSMPAHAIATGMVDFILEPDLMPVAIEDYVKYGTELFSDSKDDEKNIKAIVGLIKEKMPFDFTDYKLTTLLRRTKRRAAYSNFTTLGNYLDFLKTDQTEVQTLAKDFLISVTSFFRDKEAFNYIQAQIFPDLLKRLEPDEELKMWVAGCATGEEVYSLAILLAELLKDSYKGLIIKIFATDIDSAALLHAGKGVYSPTIAKDVSAERLKKYFIKEGANYRVTPFIRKMVIFAQHDMVKNPPYCNMQFVSCRNMLIYMTSVLQKKIYTMLLFGLKKDGYLFLGSSENPMPIMKNLEVVNKKWKIYKNLESKRVLRFDAFMLPEVTEVKRTASPFSRNNTGKNITANLAEAMHVDLAYQMDYLAVCVDEHNQVVKSYGDTTKYLLQKHFTADLVELLPKPLVVAFNTLRKKAEKTNEKVTITEIKIKNGQYVRDINVTVSPLIVKAGEQNLFMVTFSENRSVTSSQEATVFDEKIYLDEYTVNLEEESKELKDKLHNAYEQLDASNENMQSFNEELLSANEEMQSSNEEMQSVNEELDTINADYQLKNKELLEINDDLNNYFRSNLNGQLFINNELLLMRFSPGTVKQINLLESDIGRPLSNISTNIKFETILDDIKEVISKGNVITKEIETNNGKWYQIMTMPYVHSDHKNSGAIITFNDITELKTTQLDLDKKNKTLQRINADLDHFIHAASHDLLAPLGNIETSINIMNKIKLTDVKLTDFLKIINGSIKKFRELITDIGTIAKVENDMIKMEVVDLDDIINNIEWSLENKIKDSGAIINRDLEIKHIYFSKKNLRSILYNLVSNAIKFRRDEIPVINIRTEKKGDFILLSVQDNGKGIPKGGLDKIFDMYGRLNQEVEGHGIGLYLAKKIVNAASGNIVVESEPGQGSKFMIYLKEEPEHIAVTTSLN
jgi:two-component system CheB/CheR fusion protein